MCLIPTIERVVATVTPIMAILFPKRRAELWARR
jgi:hypothetical protein